MRAVPVIVVDIFGEQTLYVALIQRDNVIEQLAPTTFNPTLRNSILPGAFEGSSDGVNLQGADRYRDFQPIFPIPVKDQKSRSRPKRKRLPQLLNDPSTSRVLRDVEMQDASAIMADDKKAIEHAEGNRRDREEVHSSDRFPMVTQKREPALGGLRISWRSFHPTRDRSLRNIKTEHKEFSVDARRSPSRVLSNHLEDQLANLFGDPPSPDLLTNSGDQFPIQTEPRSVPTDDSFGRDDNENLFPSRPESTNRDPEEPVDECQAWPRMPTFQDRELLAEREILQDKVPTTTKEANKSSETKSE
jgi:hypothetical protein